MASRGARREISRLFSRTFYIQSEGYVVRYRNKPTLIIKKKKRYSYFKLNAVRSGSTETTLTHRHTQNVSIKIITSNVFLCSYEGVHDVRVAYGTYEHVDMKGLVIHKHVLLRTLKVRHNLFFQGRKRWAGILHKYEINRKKINVKISLSVGLSNIVKKRVEVQNLRDLVHGRI